jgi:hypothetical protein
MVPYIVAVDNWANAADENTESTRIRKAKQAERETFIIVDLLEVEQV